MYLERYNLNPTTVATNTQGNEVAWFVHNDGTATGTVSESFGLSGPGTVTYTGGAQGITLQPGEQIDTDLDFDTGSATGTITVIYHASLSCGASAADTITVNVQ